MELVTGEKIQKLADIYLGKDDGDFLFNPAIGLSNKNMYIKDIPEKFDNPKIIYCYSFRLLELSDKINNFINPFILISGNADTNIVETEIRFKMIADHPKLINWYSQNVCFKHTKLNFLPIGIANKQWEHGNIEEIQKIINMNIPKTKLVYFNFKLETNIEKRLECFKNCCNYIEFLPIINPIENTKRLAEYKFCICPEGNGVDTHRLWECWYLKVVPIVLNNNFYKIIMEKINMPIIILNNWNEILSLNIDYKSYIFNDNEKYLDFNYYKSLLV